MFKKSNLFAAISLAVSTMTFSSFASADTCYTTGEDNSIVQLQCERIVLIDFDENIQVQSGSTSFSDWTEVLQGTYESSVGEGSVTINGNNGAYNYHGVRGTTPNEFINGESIVVTYYNKGTEAQSFYPRISFDDANSFNGSADGFWIRSDEPITVYPNSYYEYHLSLHKGVTASLINTNVGHNGTGQQDIVVDKIEYVNISDSLRPTTPCVTAIGEDFSRTSQCSDVQLIQFGYSKAETLKSMDASVFSEVHGNEQYQLISQMGNSSTVLKQNIHNVPLVDAATLNERVSYAGVRTAEGVTHSFKAGEAIIVEVEVGQLAADADVTASISFDDSDNIPYGESGTWYTLQTRTATTYSTLRFAYVFDEASAGEHSLINVILSNNLDAKAAISNIHYLTKSDVKSTLN